MMKDKLFENIMSPQNRQPIEMYDREGNKYCFEKVGLVIGENEKSYCLLKPIIDGMPTCETVVFLVCVGEDGLAFLKEEEDAKTIENCLRKFEVKK